jgi:aerobic carbon-monoxide dehydrogenase medium subunit
MFPASFGYVAARSLEDAVKLLQQHGDEAKLLAGGHSLIPAMKLRLAAPRYLIDLNPIAELRGIRLDGDQLAIGALTLHADVASSDLVRQHLPGLAEAAAVIGDLQVRNRGTIGGSVAHADPAADFPVILTALNASFSLLSPAGSRTVSVKDFFLDFYTTALAPDEILTEIRVPLPAARTGTAYAKLGHPASGYVVVSAGVLLTCSSAGECAAIRVAIGGLAGVPLRATATERALQGKSVTVEAIAAAAAMAAEGSDPNDDSYASADYRREVASVYTRRAMTTAVDRARGKA